MSSVQKMSLFSSWSKRFGYFITMLLLAGACSEETTKTVEVEVEKARVAISGDYSVEVGETIVLTAETVGGVDTSYTWTSSDTAIATVAEDGTVSGVAAGTAMIVATGAESGLSGERGVVVTEGGAVIPPDPRVSIAGGYAVAVGKTSTLTATTTDGVDATYTWASSDDTIATVADGVVTGVKAGEVVITATGDDTDAVGEHPIVVVADGEPPGEPVIVLDGDYVVQLGETTTLTAETINGTDSGYDWATSDENVATVADGVVTSVAAGQAVITATGKDTGAEGKIGIVVMESVVAPVVTVEIEGEYLLQQGETTQLTATTFNGTDSGYIWTSSAEDVASVENGLVHGDGIGEAVITAVGIDSGAIGKIGMVVTGAGPSLPPQQQEWQGSAHADITAEAFTNWNADGAVPANCAKCHSEGGYLDYLGADGSPAGTVESPAALGTTVTCLTCHNAKAVELSAVAFPSGVVVEDLGPDARCIACHQGRSSGPTVEKKIVDLALADDDVTNETLTFQNIHYFAAAATKFGSTAKGGYEYADHYYTPKFDHVPGLDTCINCHNQHTLEVRVDVCGDCHTGTTSVAALDDLRMFGSTGDYDGDGDTTEGLRQEVAGLGATLMLAIQKYAKDKLGKEIAYSDSTHPYFFIDTNKNGMADAEEVTSANRYAPFSPRLLRATYNYQIWKKDPGAFAHNGKYIVQLLHDSISDLNSALAQPVAFAGDRGDGGHFDGDSQAWRNWDSSGTVPANCSKCHTGAGFQDFVTYGVTTPHQPDHGLACTTCHTSMPGFELVKVDKVVYPSTVTITDPGNSSNICATCHSGRESKASIDTAISTNKLSFKNIHYLPAAATLQGADAHVGYEYDGKTYAGKSTHIGGSDCMSCHSGIATNHSFNVFDNAAKCATCHGTTDIKAYRMGSVLDYDGDKNTTEGLGEELSTLAELVYEQMQVVADMAGKPILYNEASYPYFFADTNGNGILDPDEAVSANSYKNWTPELLKASFNFQFYHKEPGAYAHNFKYMGQLLFDSYEDLGGDTTGLKRP